MGWAWQALEVPSLPGPRAEGGGCSALTCLQPGPLVSLPLCTWGLPGRWAGGTKASTSRILISSLPPLKLLMAVAGCLFSPAFWALLQEWEMTFPGVKVPGTGFQTPSSLSQVCVCMCVYMRAYVCIFVCVCVHVCMCLHVCVHVCLWGVCEWEGAAQCSDQAWEQSAPTVM